MKQRGPQKTAREMAMTTSQRRIILKIQKPEEVLNCSYLFSTRNIIFGQIFEFYLVIQSLLGLELQYVIGFSSISCRHFLLANANDLSQGKTKRMRPLTDPQSRKKLQLWRKGDGKIPTKSGFRRIKFTRALLS